jgi:hypothetical protein
MKSGSNTKFPSEMDTLKAQELLKEPGGMSVPVHPKTASTYEEPELELAILGPKAPMTSRSNSALDAPPLAIRYRSITSIVSFPDVPPLAFLRRSLERCDWSRKSQAGIGSSEGAKKPGTHRRCSM